MEKRDKINKDSDAIFVQNLIYGKNHTIRDIANRFGSNYG